MMNKRGKFNLLFALPLFLGGCATHGDPRDPIEGFNRAIYSFNDTVDRVALKPIATGYRAITPSPMQQGVRNFYSNLDDVTVFANNLLQLKVAQASSDLLRVAFNTTFGFLGLIDIATPMGLKKHNEDFGQTLGYWGADSGPYLVLPFFGPSSVRDGVGRVVDSMATDLVQNNDDVASRNQTVFLSVVSRRADLLDAREALAEAALDEYEFARDFYLERRETLVFDGQSRFIE